MVSMVFALAVSTICRKTTVFKRSERVDRRASASHAEIPSRISNTHVIVDTVFQRKTDLGKGTGAEILFGYGRVSTDARDTS